MAMEGTAVKIRSASQTADAPCCRRCTFWDSWASGGKKPCATLKVLAWPGEVCDLFTE